VGLGDLDGVPPQGVDHLQVLLEHVRMLVILAGDVLPDGCREGERRGLAKGQAKEVAGGGQHERVPQRRTRAGDAGWGKQQTGKGTDLAMVLLCGVCNGLSLSHIPRAWTFAQPASVDRT
jgi:hypothetical protein